MPSAVVHIVVVVGVVVAGVAPDPVDGSLMHTVEGVLVVVAAASVVHSHNLCLAMTVGCYPSRVCTAVAAHFAQYNSQVLLWALALQSPNIVEQQLWRQPGLEC
ncbi:hypothetical protein Dimus_037991 [Dionaea muscipula]